MQGAVHWQMHKTGWNGALEVNQQSSQNTGAGSVQVSMALGLDVQGENDPSRRRDRADVLSSLLA